MKNIDRLLAEARNMRSSCKTVTVCFIDGTRAELPVMEAFHLCANDRNVIDASTDNPTSTSFFRAIISADKDADLPELAEKYKRSDSDEMKCDDQ